MASRQSPWRTGVQAPECGRVETPCLSPSSGEANATGPGPQLRALLCLRGPGRGWAEEPPWHLEAKFAAWERFLKSSPGPGPLEWMEGSGQGRTVDSGRRSHTVLPGLDGALRPWAGCVPMVCPDLRCHKRAGEKSRLVMVTGQADGPASPPAPEREQKYTVEEPSQGLRSAVVTQNQPSSSDCRGLRPYHASPIGCVCCD